MPPYNKKKRFQPKPWNLETGFYPDEGQGVIVTDVYMGAAKYRRNPSAIPEFKDASWGSFNHPEISMHWLETWGENGNYDGKKDLMLATEEICRAEGARLGLNAVVIRAGLHNKRNQHASNGTVVTYECEYSGMIRNDVKDAGWHFTIYMGCHREDLIVQGHIYVAFDHKAKGGLRITMNPAAERKHVAEHEEHVAAEYFTDISRPKLSFFVSLLSFCLVRRRFLCFEEVLSYSVAT